MTAWPERRVLDLFGIELPIILAPMAGPGTPQLAIAVSEAGGLGSLACAMLSVAQARDAGHHPPGHLTARERELLLPHATGGRPCARGGVAGPPCAVLPRARPGSRRDSAGGQPRSVRRGLLRAGRGAQA